VVLKAASSLPMGIWIAKLMKACPFGLNQPLRTTVPIYTKFFSPIAKPRMVSMISTLLIGDSLYFYLRDFLIRPSRTHAILQALKDRPLMGQRVDFLYVIWFEKFPLILLMMLLGMLMKHKIISSSRLCVGIMC
jgi:hypothetical protein